MNLDIILRTHDGGDVHTYAPRLFGAPKSQVIQRCVRSLAQAAAHVPGARIRIIDDHSSDTTVQFLSTIGEVTALPRRGNNESMLKAFSMARDSTADYVYLVEDDFLHLPQALTEMLGFHELAATRDLPSIATHPYDDADNYQPKHMENAIILPGHSRHWRRNAYSTCTVLVRPAVLRENWPLWQQMAAWYEKDGGETHEGTTLSHIWRGAVTLFTPLPGLAAHINHQTPPLFPIDELWRQYA